MTVIAITYDAIIDSTTASASALNRYLVTPNRNITGKKTITVVSVEASTASESSTRRPMASAKPPRVMMLMVWLLKYRPKAPARIESGIERRIAKVERKLPRKIRIISDASTAPETASCSRLATAARIYWD